MLSPAHLSKEELALTNGSNAVLTAPFSDAKINALFKRAFSLPKQCLFVSGSTYEEFSLALSSMGYDFKCLSSAEEALQDDSPELPDFIIVEYNLSGMNGLEFLERPANPNDWGRFLFSLPTTVGKSGISNPFSRREWTRSSFPLCLGPQPQADTGPLSSSSKGRRLRALVDDSPTIRELVSSMFKELDYHVETAENGFEGYKAVERLKPDIITSDYDMPVLNGWEFCTEVRDHEEYKDIPIVMITTRATEMDMKKGELLGVSAYLAKPFQKDTLKSAVETAIAHAGRSGNKRPS